jgi:cyclase
MVINTQALRELAFVGRAAEICGSQSVVASIDVKRDLLGRARVFRHADKHALGEPAELARALERAGAGELLLNAVHRDGTREGYDLPLIQQVSAAVHVPVVAAGGAGSLDDFARALRAGASAVAAGSFFVFHGPRRAVLITYPERRELEATLLPATAARAHV